MGLPTSQSVGGNSSVVVPSSQMISFGNIRNANEWLARKHSPVENGQRPWGYSSWKKKYNLPIGLWKVVPSIKQRVNDNQNHSWHHLMWVRLLPKGSKNIGGDGGKSRLLRTTDKKVDLYYCENSLECLQKIKTKPTMWCQGNETIIEVILGVLSKISQRVWGSAYSNQNKPTCHAHLFQNIICDKHILLLVK